MPGSSKSYPSLEVYFVHFLSIVMCSWCVYGILNMHAIKQIWTDVRGQMLSLDTAGVNTLNWQDISKSAGLNNAII